MFYFHNQLSSYNNKFNKKGKGVMKNFILIFIVVLNFIPLCLLNANVRNVPGNYPTIQSAINTAVNGDTILVAPGIYYENVNFRGKGILLSSYFLHSHDTSFISNTIINGSTPIYPDSASCVLMMKPDSTSAEDTTASLVGFTITGGHGLVWLDPNIPGIYREGGGILVQNWSPRIRYNRIIGNTIYDVSHPHGGGGGIHCGIGCPIVENNIIQNNYGYCGMGICIYFVGGIYRNNIFAGNYGGTDYGCGAVYTFGNYKTYPVIIENNTVVNNSAYNGSGGLRIYETKDVTIKNNIIWGNIPLQLYQTGSVSTVSFCDIQNGSVYNGNINLNPQFVGNSFYLNPTSPCVDAGDTIASCKDPEDSTHIGYALLPALGIVRNDMGAFGGPHCSLIGSSVIGIKNYGTNSIITDFALAQNFPNPFNPVTNISYQLPASGHVVMKIFDLIGKEIKTIVQSTQNRGKYSVIWNGKDNSGSNVASGVYIYNVQFITDTKTIIKSRKMLLIK
jgi:hypothetical protein